MPLDRDAAEPLHRQLEADLRAGIRDGRLGSRARSCRRRARSRRSSACRAASSSRRTSSSSPRATSSRGPAARPGSRRGATSSAGGPRGPREPASFEFDFRPGRPDVTEFPRAAWLRSLRRVLAEAPADRFTYLGGRGVPELRIALAGVPQPRPRDGRGARRRRRVDRVLAGPRAAAAGAGRPRRASDRRRGPVRTPEYRARSSRAG